MAEDREGMQPQENVVENPDVLKRGVRERAKGILDHFIDQNPVVREQARSMDRVQAALPERRIKDAVGMVGDVLKVPKAAFAIQLELLKRVIPGFSLVAFIPEQIGAFGNKAAGFVAEKVVESAPAKFAVGTVEGVMDGILGKRAPQAEAPKATLDNAHQILVGMARPELGRQERRKMG